jgi:hypothetical protein
VYGIRFLFSLLSLKKKKKFVARSCQQYRIIEKWIDDPTNESGKVGMKHTKKRRRRRRRKIYFTLATSQNGAIIPIHSGRSSPSSLLLLLLLLLLWFFICNRSMLATLLFLFLACLAFCFSVEQSVTTHDFIVSCPRPPR